MGALNQTGGRGCPCPTRPPVEAMPPCPVGSGRGVVCRCLCSARVVAWRGGVVLPALPRRTKMANEINMFDKLIAVLDTAEAAKDFDLRAAVAEIYPEPMPADDYAKLLAAKPKGLPDAVRRVLKLGGKRYAQVVADADALVEASGGLIRSTTAVVVGKLADAEIETVRAAGATDAMHREVVKNAALRGIRKWESAELAARNELAALYQKAKALPAKMGLADEELAELRGAMAIVAKFA